MTANTIVTTPASPFDTAGKRQARVIWSTPTITRVQFPQGYPATFATQDLKVAK